MMARRIGNLDGAVLIYSMWDGYLTDDYKKAFAEKSVKIKLIHTSGHAVLDDLKKFAKAIKPKKIIPIHTFNPADYKKLFGNTVELVPDGRIYEV